VILFGCESRFSNLCQRYIIYFEELITVAVIRLFLSLEPHCRRFDICYKKQ